MIKWDDILFKVVFAIKLAPRSPLLDDMALGRFISLTMDINQQITHEINDAKKKQANAALMAAVENACDQIGKHDYESAFATLARLVEEKPRKGASGNARSRI